MYLLISCIKETDSPFIFEDGSWVGSAGYEYEGKSAEAFTPILFLAASEDQSKLQTMKETAQDKENLLRETDEELSVLLRNWRLENPEPKYDKSIFDKKKYSTEERDLIWNEYVEKELNPHGYKAYEAEKDFEQQLSIKYSVSQTELGTYRPNRYLVIVEVPSI